MNPDQWFNPRQPQNNPSQPAQAPITNPQPSTPADYRPSSLNNVPYGAGQPLPPQQPQSPVQSGGGAINDPEDGPKSRRGLIIAGIAAGSVLLLIIIIAVVVAGSGSEKKAEQSQSATDSTQPASLQPAQALEVEQVSNSLSQDLSRLDDEKDFPSSEIEDKALGL